MMVSRLKMMLPVILAGLMWSGCKQPGSSAGNDTSAAPANVSSQQQLEYVKTAADPLVRLEAAQQLAKLPPEQIKPMVNDLKQALSKERNPSVRQAIKSALEAAR